MLTIDSCIRVLVMTLGMAASTLGCAGGSVESTWADNGAKTASFDLRCPEEKIVVSVLNRNDGLGCFGSRVGVNGCGRQTTYDCDNARTWHRSSEVQTTSP